jgi:NAD+ kinase
VKILCGWNRNNAACRTAAESLTQDLRGAQHTVVENPGPGDVTDGELLLLLGGDGFLMESLRRLDYPSLPVFGVNFGTVGFLMNPRDCLPEVVSMIKDWSFTEEEHPVLRAQVELESGGREELHAFNDFVLERMTRQSLRLQLFLDEVPFNHYAGDGFVFSTAAGSTAYNLAAGGPVVHPGIPALLVTPLYPHRASPFHSVQFTLVVPLASRLKVVASDLPKRRMRLVADGSQIEGVCAAEVADSGKRIRLLRPRSHLFVKTLTRKFIGG